MKGYNFQQYTRKTDQVKKSWRNSELSQCDRKSSEEPHVTSSNLVCWRHWVLGSPVIPSPLVSLQIATSAANTWPWGWVCAPLSAILCLRKLLQTLDPFCLHNTVFYLFSPASEKGKGRRKKRISQINNDIDWTERAKWAERKLLSKLSLGPLLAGTPLATIKKPSG